jgi:putative DNA-invertase from lambdoid prophage Rac
MTAALYARVSTQDQDCALQLRELRDYCTRAGWDVAEYVETGSGKAGNRRPELERLLSDARLRKFGAVVVWKIDRFGRSVQEFTTRVCELDRLGIRFVAPSQGIDTDQANPAGRLLLHMLAAIAEFERELIRERVASGMASAKIHGTRSGKPIGRPRRICARGRVAEMREAGQSFGEIARALNLPRSTVFRIAAE